MAILYPNFFFNSDVRFDRKRHFKFVFFKYKYISETGHAPSPLAAMFLASFVKGHLVTIYAKLF